MLHRRDYKLLAEVIRDTRSMIGDNNQEMWAGVNLLIGKLCIRLALDNVLFDEVKFLEACVPGGMKLAKGGE